MKTCLILICLLFPVNAYAAEKVLTLATMAIIDYNQSCKMFYGPDSANHIELNPLLGEKPSRNKLLAFGVVGVGSVWLLDSVLKDGLFKDVLLDSILETERFNIQENRLVTEGKARQFNAIIIKVSFKI